VVHDSSGEFVMRLMRATMDSRFARVMVVAI
jgi:hypothetical protein